MLEVFVVIGEPILDLAWQVDRGEFFGRPGAKELNDVTDEGGIIDGLTLVALVAGGAQMLDGAFVGRDRVAGEPRIVVESVRGDEWDVYGPQGVLDRFAARFETSPLPVEYQDT